jgi:hypothetical protein
MNAESLARTAALIAVLGLLAGASPSPAYKMLGEAGRLASATEVTCDNLDGFVHWYSPVIYWHHNLYGAGADKADALKAAMAAWNNVSTTGHQGIYEGTQLIPGASIRLDDGMSMVSWGYDGWCGGATSSCLAITTFNLSSGTSSISEADILFNRDKTWTTNGSNYDVQAVATHEFGHAWGIAHTDVPGSSPPPTMTSIYQGSGWRSLENDDRAALQCSEDWYVTPAYYGEHWTTNCREITGIARNTKRPNGTTWVQVRNGSQIVSELHTSGPTAHFFDYTPSSTFKDGRYHTVNITHRWRSNSWLAGTGQSLICKVPVFDNETPSEFNPTGGTPWSVGNIFYSDIPGYVTHLRYYKAAEETGSHELKLWTESGQFLASVTVNFGSGTGWVTGKLAGDGYPIQANTDYVVSVTTYTRQSKTSCGLSSPIDNGPLTAHGGVWKQGDGVFPDTGSCSNYWTDVYFDQ